MHGVTKRAYRVLGFGDDNTTGNYTGDVKHNDPWPWGLAGGLETPRS